MFDIRTSATAPSTFVPQPIEFITIQLTPLADGQLSVSLKSTVFDESEYELIDQDVVDERVTSVEGLLDLIKRHVQIGPATPLPSYSS